jgi:hypothetical protein
MAKKSNTVQTISTDTVQSPKDIAVSMRESGKSTSDIIRALAQVHTKPNGEVDRGAITKTLKDAGVQTKNGTDIKYQHVRNTLLLPVKKQPSMPQILPTESESDIGDGDIEQEVTE